MRYETIRNERSNSRTTEQPNDRTAERPNSRTAEQPDIQNQRRAVPHGKIFGRFFVEKSEEIRLIIFLQFGSFLPFSIIFFVL